MPSSVPEAGWPSPRMSKCMRISSFPSWSAEGAETLQKTASTIGGSERLGWASMLQPAANGLERLEPSERRPPHDKSQGLCFSFIGNIESEFASDLVPVAFQRARGQCHNNKIMVQTMSSVFTGLHVRN